MGFIYITHNNDIDMSKLGWPGAKASDLLPFPMIPAGPQMTELSRFIRSHPGFYVGHDGHGVVVSIECVDDDGEWREYQTILSRQGALDALGY